MWRKFRDGRFVRRIERLKGGLIDLQAFAGWAEQLRGPDAALEREFAGVYRLHERLLAEAGARDAGDLVRDALRLAG